MNARLDARIVVTLAIALVGCTPHRPTTPAPAHAPTEEIVDRLARLALGEPLAVERVRAVTEDINSSRLTWSAFIDELTTDRRFAWQTAPDVILADVNVPGKYSINMEMVLRESRDPSGVKILYLSKPCAKKDAVLTHPWWSMKSEVLVCRQDTEEKDFRVVGTSSCVGETDPDRNCGCGRNLVLCTPDPSLFVQIGEAERQETSGTIANNVEADRPIEGIFLDNASYRTPLAEFAYERERFLRHEIATLPDWREWPAEGKMAPRSEVVPGQHAGILTLPQVAYSRNALRVRQTVYSQLLWCSSTRSLHTRAEALFGLGSTNLRDGEGWKALSKMTFCTDCHARLDYGMQFFSVLPRPVDGWVQDVSKLHPDTQLQVYVNNINDPRGEAPVTPLGYAQLAVRQPEFGQCETQRVLTHVFGSDIEPIVAKEVRKSYDESHHSFRAMFRTALLAYVRSQYAVAPAQMIAAVPAATTERIVFTPSFKKSLEDRCEGCHSSGAVDLAVDSVPRELAFDVLNQLAMRTMPKTVQPTLGADERRTMINTLIDQLWSDDEGRKNARAYFVDELTPTPIFRADVTLAALERAAGPNDAVPLWPLPEVVVGTDVASYTPGLFFYQAIAAVRACEHRKPNSTTESVDACVQRVLRYEDVVIHR